MSSFIIRQVGSDSDSCESQNTNIVAFLHVNNGMITIILQMSHFSIFSVDRSLLNGFEREENDKDDSSLVNIITNYIIWLIKKVGERVRMKEKWDLLWMYIWSQDSQEILHRFKLAYTWYCSFITCKILSTTRGFFSRLIMNIEWNVKKMAPLFWVTSVRTHGKLGTFFSFFLCRIATVFDIFSAKLYLAISV